MLQAERGEVRWGEVRWGEVRDAHARSFRIKGACHSLVYSFLFVIYSSAQLQLRPQQWPIHLKQFTILFSIAFSHLLIFSFKGYNVFSVYLIKLKNRFGIILQYFFFRKLSPRALFSILHTTHTRTAHTQHRAICFPMSELFISIPLHRIVVRMPFLPSTAHSIVESSTPELQDIETKSSSSGDI